MVSLLGQKRLLNAVNVNQQNKQVAEYHPSTRWVQLEFAS